MWGKNVALRNASFELALCRCCVSESCLSSASLDVVCIELSDGVKYVGVYEYVNIMSLYIFMVSMNYSYQVIQ